MFFSFRTRIYVNSLKFYIFVKNIRMQINSISNKNNISEKENSIILFHNADYELTKEGKILLKIPRFKSEKFRRLFGFLSKNHFHNILLDQEGSELWKIIDGETSIEELSKQLAKKLNEDYDETHKRTSEYIKEMLKFNYIKTNK